MVTSPRLAKAEWNWDFHFPDLLLEQCFRTASCLHFLISGISCIETSYRRMHWGSKILRVQLVLAWPHKAWVEYHRNRVFSREPSLLKQEGTKSKMVIKPNFSFFQTGSIFKVSRNSKMAPLAGNWVFNIYLMEDIYWTVVSITDLSPCKSWLH